MNVDASIVKYYLADKESYEHHWLFACISDDDDTMFDRPDKEKKAAVTDAMNQAITTLDSFNPYNANLFQKLFPTWKELSTSVNVILAVGCPAPYDAMVRKHAGKEFIIFDLIRLLDYKTDISKLIMPLFTHELAHICIHADYPDVSDSQTYCKKLEYITFDEGFAHLLSYKDNIETVDFRALLQEHYQASQSKLRSAMMETNSEKQVALLDESNCGAYWDKFAAICGKLFLASHLNEIVTIYKAGPENMLKRILQNCLS